MTLDFSIGDTVIFRTPQDAEEREGIVRGIYPTLRGKFIEIEATIDGRTQTKRVRPALVRRP